jgi:predicted lipid-binding transport protein (Tim44 family)
MMVVLMMKEDNGIFFSIEAALGLIPIIIIIMTVSNTNIDYTDSYMEKQYFQKAQNTAELMDQYTGNNGQTLLEEVTTALSENPDKMKGTESAKDIIDPFSEKKPLEK